MVLEMLTGDQSILYPGSIYKHLPKFCTVDAYLVFMGLGKFLTSNCVRCVGVSVSPLTQFQLIEECLSTKLP